MLDGKFNCDNQYKPNSIRIYPIILLHNRQLETLGVNQILRHWWREEIIKLTQDSFQVSNIKDVVVMNIDSLIFHSDNLKVNKIRLEELIDGYLLETNQELLEKKVSKSDNERMGVFQDSCLPFSDYIGRKFTWKLPSIFEEKGLTLFEER